MRKATVLICFVMMLMCGCQKDSRVVYSADDLSKDLEKYFQADFSVSTESLASLKYNTMSVTEQELLCSFLKKCEIIGINGIYPSYTVKVNYPDLEQIKNTALQDTNGIIKDYQNAVLRGYSEQEISGMVQAYFTKLLNYTEVAKEEREVTVEISAEEPFQIVSDSELFPIIMSVVDFDYAMCLSDGAEVGSMAETTLSTEKEQSVLTQLDANKSFLCSKDGKKILIGNIQVLKGKDAVSAVKELSPANAAVNVSSNDKVFYLKYEVTNLSNENIIVPNGFCFSKDGTKLLNDGLAVSGLQDVIELGGRKKGFMTCFLVGSDDSILVWSSTEVVGCYEIVVP